MKSFLWFTLVVGLCISSSCGKEKLKIDLPENFQVDFIKSFARVMRSDYPHCHINPQEMFGKVGQEFLKRARAGGMGIHLEDDNGRSKRAVDGILAKLKAPFGGFGKRSVDENNGEASQRNKRSPQALKGLKNFASLGKRSTGEEERTKRALDPITKLTTKLGGLKAPLGFRKRSTGEDGERTKRALDPITKLTTKLASLKAPLGLGKRSAGEENDGERRKRSLETLKGLETALKGTLGLGKRSIDENKEETNLRTKRSLETLTGLKTALKGTLGLGKRSIDEDSEMSLRTKRSLETLKSTLGLTGKLGKRSVDDVWTPEDEYLAQKFNVGRVRVTDEGTFPFLDVSEGESLSDDGNHQGLRKSQGLPTKLKSKIGLDRNYADGNVWTPEDEDLARKFNVGRVRVSAQDSIPSHDGKRPSDGYFQTLQRAQDQETLPTSQEILRRSQGLATKLKSEIGLRKNSVDNVWTPEDEEIANSFNVDRVRYSHVVSEGASPSQGNQGFKNSQTGFGPKRKIGLGSQPAQTETDQNRERRSAFEMLMENIDEVKVKKSADLNQGNAKRKRRSLMDLLSDPGQAGNVEF